MGAAENAAVVRRWVEEFVSGGNLDLVDELVAETLVAGPGQTPIADARRRLRLSFAAYRQAFPDLRMTADELLASDDTVTLCWTCTGTHTGHFSHPELRTFGVPPSGRAARWSGVTVFWFADGRIARVRTGQDTYGLLRQLGLVSPLGGGGGQA